MARSGTLPVEVNTELIVWARVSIGYTPEEAAGKLRMSPDRLAELESGTRPPSLGQLRRMAVTYKRPLAVFFLREVPTEFGVARLEDFRRLPEAERRRSPTLNRAIRRADYRREVLIDLAEAEGVEIPQFEPIAELPEDPEALGQHARRVIGVPLEVQYGWRDSRTAWNAWRAAFGRANILVFQAAAVEISEMRGFSIYFDTYPIVVVNRKDTYNGRVFTLFHELAHLLVRQSGLCDLIEAHPARIGGYAVEAFCNRASAAALIPADVLINHDAVREWKASDWPEPRLQSMARTFSVSSEVVLRRLLDLGKTTVSFYTQKRQEYMALYEQARQRQEQRARSSSGFIAPSTEAVSDSGRFYATSVLDALSQDRITIADASDYLNVRVKHLSRIQDILMRDTSGEAST